MTPIQEYDPSFEHKVIEFPYGEIRNPLIDPRPDSKTADIIDIKQVRDLQDDNS